MKMVDWKTWDVTQLIAPAGCLGCGRDLASPLCAACLSRLEVFAETGCLRCGNPDVHADSQNCEWCRRLECLPAHICSLYPYRELSRDLFHQVKFKGYWRLLRPMLENGIQRFFRCLPVDRYRGLVPVPESWVRKWKRHFNPARLIAERLALHTGLPVIEPLAVRSFQTRQVGLTYAERCKNVRGRFRLRKPLELEAVILVDDVLTTGATLQEATRVLQEAGVREIAWFSLLRTL